MEEPSQKKHLAGDQASTFVVKIFDMGVNKEQRVYIQVSGFRISFGSVACGGLPA